MRFRSSASWQKGSDSAWRKFRAAQIKLRPLCPCGKPAEELHHIRSLHKGGAKFDSSNVTPMCKPCHWQETENENAARTGRTPRKIQPRPVIDAVTGLPLSGHPWCDDDE